MPLVAAPAQVRVPGLFTTQRKDGWWVAPLFQVLGFLLFAGYTTWAALQGNHFLFGPYLSPFYSPVLWAAPGDTAAFHHAWFGYAPAGLPYPSFIPFSPAVFILGGPLGFRLSCYYYRKFYYRGAFFSPPGCAVGTLTGASYKGEKKGFFWLWNFHRFFLYIALGFIALLTWDAIQSFRFDDGFHVNVGSLVLTLNAVLLAGFTFGCNSLRHLVGGGADCFSCEKGGAVKYKAWSIVSFFNRHHMGWAWFSMYAVGIADLYVRLCSMGVIRDARLF